MASAVPVADSAEAPNSLAEGVKKKYRAGSWVITFNERPADFLAEAQSSETVSA
jgi:hypothetical protein